MAENKSELTQTPDHLVRTHELEQVVLALVAKVQQIQNGGVLISTEK